MHFVEDLNFYQALDGVVRFVLDDFDGVLRLGLEVDTLHHLPKGALPDVVHYLVLDVLRRYDYLILPQDVLASSSEAYFLSA